MSSSVIGRGCRIGKGAQIIDSYLFDNVTVWEGARIENSILCEGVTVMPNAYVKEGTVISFKVRYKAWPYVECDGSILQDHLLLSLTPSLRIFRLLLCFRLSLGGARLSAEVSASAYAETSEPNPKAMTSARYRRPGTSLPLVLPKATRETSEKGLARPAFPMQQRPLPATLSRVNSSSQTRVSSNARRMSQIHNLWQSSIVTSHCAPPKEF